MSELTLGSRAALTPFQRILVGTDGTVTHILEAYADEPIEVEKLRQEVDSANGDDADLDLSADERVLRRTVLLRGRRSRRPLLYAEVVVALDRVEPAFLDGLTTTDKPIGTLLRQHRTETFREILLVDREPAGRRGSHFGIGPEAELILRTYRILSARRPSILVTETFPAESFRTLPG